MANMLTVDTDKPNLKPPPMSPQMTSGIQAILRKLSPDGEGKFSISSRLAPSAMQRTQLVAREATIAAALRPGGSAAVEAAIALVVGLLHSPGTDNSDPELTVTAYQAALADLPAWAVTEACHAALRGKVGSSSGRFRPSPGELHKAAEALLAGPIRELRAIAKILQARVTREPLEGSQARAAVLARVRDSVRKFKEGLEVSPSVERRGL